MVNLSGSAIHKGPHDIRIFVSFRLILSCPLKSNKSTTPSNPPIFPRDSIDEFGGRDPNIGGNEVGQLPVASQ